MRTFEDILHPITPAQFRAEYEGRRPLHIPAPAGAAKHELLSWDAFNRLLNQSATWDSDRLQLMRNQAPLPPEAYCRLKPTPTGPTWRPKPDKVAVLVGAGASILANDMLTRHGPIREAGAALGQAFAAEVGASVFCSFKGVPALLTHYDLHEIIAVQTEGEKTWNLYEGRAETPLDYPAELTQSDVERARGKLVATVHMKPGDVLYMPRGVYHDAVALDQPSLHVSFTIMPLTGRAILSLLDEPAMREALFREWLPPADQDHGRALENRLNALGQALARMVSSPAFREEVAMLQHRLIPRNQAVHLPEPPTLTFYRTAGRAFPAAGTAVRQVYDWMIGQRRFAAEDMLAQFDTLPEPDLRAALEAAERAGAVQRV